MKREAEEPTGHLLTSPPSVPKPGDLGESMRNYDMFAAGWFVVLPLGGLPAGEVAACVERPMDWAQSMGESEVVEIGPEWESSNVSLASAVEASPRRNCDCEVRKRVKAT